MKNIPISLSTDLNNFNRTIAILCLKKDSNLMQSIIENDTIFFNHPSITSYFNYPSVDKPLTFSQLFIGYKGLVIDGSEVISDSNGIVYLPQLGMFTTDYKGAKFTLIEISNEIRLKNGNEILESRLTKRKYIGNSKIELIPEMPEVYYPDFRQTAWGHLINENPAFKPKNAQPYIGKALELLKKYLPDFYKELELTSSLIFVHDNSKVLNYISFNNHGAIFLYMIEEHDEVNFIEELIHQGTHNLLNTICFNKSLFFKVDVENIMIKEFINRPEDYRTVYSVIHGLASISKRVEGFEKMLDADELSEKQKHELHGRLADQFSRFDYLGFEMLNKDDVFTELGKEYFGTMYETCSKSLDRLKWVDQFDITSWRDLDFRYEDFVKYNPIENFTSHSE